MSASALVLSYIENYSARDIAPFVESLRATGYTGDVVFYTANVDNDCKALFLEHDVREIPVRRIDMLAPMRMPTWVARGLGLSSPHVIPDRSINIRLSRLFGRLGLGDTPFAREVAKRLWHCQSARFFYFQEFLERNSHYESVMIADARDVMFQRAPFDFDGPKRTYLFEEYPGTTLGQQRENAGWIQQLYGAEGLARVAEHPVICVGVLLGHRRSLLAALQTLTREFITNHIGWGTDQGVPNYFLRSGRLPDVQVRPYGHGPAMHLGIAPRQTIRTDAEGRVLDRDGNVCNILHQYDRHPDLTAALLGRPTKTVPAAATGT